MAVVPILRRPTCMQPDLQISATHHTLQGPQPTVSVQRLHDEELVKLIDVTKPSHQAHSLGPFVDRPIHQRPHTHVTRISRDGLTQRLKRSTRTFQALTKTVPIKQQQPTDAAGRIAHP